MIAPKRILIAEDDDIMRSMMVRMVQRACPHVHITEASDGQYAHELYQQHGADVIITDNHMPRMMGTTLVHTLRTDGVRVPIIMLSSDKPRKRDIVFDALTVFLLKPVPIRQLVTTLSNLLPT